MNREQQFDALRVTTHLSIDLSNWLQDQLNFHRRKLLDYQKQLSKSEQEVGNIFGMELYNQFLENKVNEVRNWSKEMEDAYHNKKFPFIENQFKQIN